MTPEWQHLWNCHGSTVTHTDVYFWCYIIQNVTFEKWSQLSEVQFSNEPWVK